MRVFVAIALVGLLSFSSAFISPEEVKAEIESHVEPLIYGLLSIPGVSRAGGGIKCYDKYLPLITAATESSKTDTETCISRAAARREDELNKVKQERENLDSQVKNVEDTLSACLQKTDDLEYLKCLKENAATLESTINAVGQTSTTLSDNLSVSYKNIDNTEDSCIKSVIAKSKSASDELLAALQNCLMNGLDDGSSDGGSESGSDGGSDSGSEGGSDGGSDSGSEGGSDGGSEGGSDSGSEGGSEGGSDNGSESGSEGGSDSGSEGGSDNGSESGSNGGSDNNSSGNSNGDSNGDSNNNSNIDSNGGSDSGVIPDENQEPEETI